MEPQSTSERVAAGYEQHARAEASAPPPTVSEASLVGGPTRVLDDYHARTEAIQNNPDLHEQVKGEQIRELRSRLQGDYLEAVRDAREKLDAAERDARRVAYPPERAMGTAQELAYARVRDRLVTKWLAYPGTIMPDYKDAIERGDDITRSVVEDVGASYADPDGGQRADLEQEITRQRFSRLTPDQLAAVSTMAMVQDARARSEQAWGIQILNLRASR